MKANFFRIETHDGRRTLAMAVVCLQQRYCGVLWRGALNVVTEVRDLEAWASAAKELLRSSPPPPEIAVARLIIDPCLERLALRAVLTEATFVTRQTSLADWAEMLRARASADGAGGSGSDDAAERVRTAAR